MNEVSKFVAKVMVGSFLGVILLIALFGGIYTVKAGTRGVLLTFGKPSMDVVEEGLHFKIPIAQSVKKLEVRTQKIETNADSASKDLQDVQTTIALNFHLIHGLVPKLYQEIGTTYQSRIIDPAIQESVKAVTATFTAEELIARRPEVRRGIQEAIKERLSKYYIQVDDLNIVNFQFSAEFDKAIESKVTAEQLKLKAERDLERIIIEKEQQIVQAQGEAEALRLQKAYLTPDLIELRRIEMQMKFVEVQFKAVEAWDGIMPYATSGMPLIDMAPRSVYGD